MIVVNFAHPLTEGHRDQLASLVGQPIARVIDVATHFDDDQPFAPQVEALVDAVGLSSEEWQTLPLLVNLPSYAPVTATVLAYLHGRCGYFPTVIRMRPRSGTTPPGFDVAEVIPLQHLRGTGRAQR